jgi:hypothetical protein
MAHTLSNIRLNFLSWWQEERSESPVLIELTAKRWKGLIVLSAIFAWSGLGLMAWQLWSGIYAPLLKLGTNPNLPLFGHLQDAFSGFSAVLGATLVASALVVGIYARFMAWWQHG